MTVTDQTITMTVSEVTNRAASFNCYGEAAAAALCTSTE